MKEEAKKWFIKAESDYHHALFSLENKEFDWAQLASQQSAEKALKSICILKGYGIIKVHDLTLLGRKVKAPDEILQHAALLNPFYTAARYPDVNDISDKKMQEQAAKDAVCSAEKIFLWCKKQIKI